jgi:hypothetical protein
MNIRIFCCCPVLAEVLTLTHCDRHVSAIFNESLILPFKSTRSISRFKSNNAMKKPQNARSIIRGITAGLALLSCVPLAKATPFASCITNNAGTISFYLNEGGGNVTITYEDGSTNASYDGVTAGTNEAAGAHTFSLTGHTTYSISVNKTGSGVPGLIASTPAIGTSRGVDANKNPTSPYFGHIYDVSGGAGVFLINPNMTLANSTAQKAGVTTWGNTGTATGTSPDWIAVAPDDFVMVTDESEGGSCVYRIAPDFSTNQLFLGPVGETAGLADGSHGVILSRALISGSVASNNVTLFEVDGDLNPVNSLFVYNINSGPLPWTNAPNAVGIPIGLQGATFNAEYLGGNTYCGLTQGPDGKIYGSTSRSGPSYPYVTISDSTGTNLLWDSETNNPPTGDWFYQPGTASATASTGITGSAVSPDGKYIVGISIDNAFVICPLTNGIPNVSQVFVVPPTSYVGNARGVCWDAADNILLSSSGLGLVQSWALGGTTTAVTTGNASGTTGFQLLQPAEFASVVATTPQASQGGVNGAAGTPVPGVFDIYRTSTNGFSTPLTVSFTLSGTATNGVYTTTPSTGITVDGKGTIVIPAGQTNVTLTVTPSTANVPRATNTVILTINGSGSYSTAVPYTDTVFIQNTSSQGLSIIPGGSQTMYKAYSNDYASFIVSRLGDTTAPAYTLSSFTFSGTAVEGVDYTAPQPVTVNPGDAIEIVTVFPLVNGQPPVDTANPVYTGNKTAVIGLGTGSGYTAATNTTSITIIDNADPTTTVLWSDALDTTNDAATWNVTYANANMVNVPADDYEVDFGYDITDPSLQANNGIIGTPPNGATKVLRVTVNKKYSPGATAGVNAYPTNVSFSGNYAVRFNMDLVQGSSLSTATEGALFGMNHNGIETNWWVGDAIVTRPGGSTTYTWTADGIWNWFCSDAGGAGNGDYIGFTGNGSVSTNTGWKFIYSGLFWPSFTNQFKNSTVGYADLGPFTSDSEPGIPANQSSFNSVTGAAASTWADVEMKQINNIVTVSVNKTVINVYTNNTGLFTNGTIMLGYDDPFASVGSTDGAAYFSNVRVVAIGAPSITGLAISGGNVVINFTTTDGDDSASSFTLLSSGTNSLASAAHVDTTTTATFTQLGAGAFQAVTPLTTNSTGFYRIKHN